MYYKMACVRVQAYPPFPTIPECLIFKVSCGGMTPDPTRLACFACWCANNSSLRVVQASATRSHLKVNADFKFRGLGLTQRFCVYSLV